VLAGPVGLVLVFASWAGLLVVGWTLIFLPHVPEGFHRATGSPADSDPVEALNVSLVTLTTLGFGDVTPDAAWLRVIVPIEALLGFGLLSASVSWLLLIHPALARRRSLAYEIALLRKAEQETGTPLVQLGTGPVEQIYAELSSRLVAVERDLVNFPVTYYFAEANERFSLAIAMPYLVELGKLGGDPSVPLVSAFGLPCCETLSMTSRIRSQPASTARARRPPRTASLRTRATMAEVADGCADRSRAHAMPDDDGATIGLGRVGGVSFEDLLAITADEGETLVELGRALGLRAGHARPALGGDLGPHRRAGLRSAHVWHGARPVAEAGISDCWTPTRGLRRCSPTSCAGCRPRPARSCAGGGTGRKLTCR